jgi:hypothetical protein
VTPRKIFIAISGILIEVIFFVPILAVIVVIGANVFSIAALIIQGIVLFLEKLVNLMEEPNNEVWDL